MCLHYVATHYLTVTGQQHCVHVQCVAIHGDISQSQRTAAVEKFKSGEVPLLIATDVAARGLDIPDVEAVINYSFPLTTEDYVHRIGRTGRAGKTGTALACYCRWQHHFCPSVRQSNFNLAAACVQCDCERC